MIRLGLHDTPTIREQMVAGYFHPAYRELVEARLYRRALAKAAAVCGKTELFVETAPHTLSKALGQHGGNRTWLAAQGISLVVKESSEVPNGKIRMKNQYFFVYEA